MPQSNQSPSLEIILNFTEDKMQNLLHVLEEETSTLKKNDIEELEKITLEKTVLTEQIEKNEQQRVKLLVLHSLDPNEPSQWLLNNKLTSLWLNIKTLSEKAQKQNQINGLVINGNRRRIQAQLDILSSSAPAEELTYTASGKNIRQRNYNTLAHV